MGKLGADLQVDGLMSARNASRTFLALQLDGLALSSALNTRGSGKYKAMLAGLRAEGQEHQQLVSLFSVPLLAFLTQACAWLAGVPL